MPLQGSRFWTNFTLAEKPSSVGEYEEAPLRFVDSGFLPLMNIPVLVGRNFTDADDASSEPVAVVSESFAHKYWPTETAVGKYITIFRDTPVARRVVGIVGDVRTEIEETAPPTMYVSYKQMSFPSMQVLLLSHDSSNSALIRVRQVVQSVDPEQPVEDVDSMLSIVQEALGPLEVCPLTTRGTGRTGCCPDWLWTVRSDLLPSAREDEGNRRSNGCWGIACPSHQNDLQPNFKAGHFWSPYGDTHDARNYAIGEQHGLRNPSQ